MRGDQQPMRPPTRRVRIVVLADQPQDRFGELLRKLRPLGWRAQAHSRIHRQGRQSLVGDPRSANKIAHLAHDPGSERDEVAGRQMIGHAGGICADRPKCCWGDDEGGRVRHHEPFRHPAPSSLRRDRGKPESFQLTKVVVHLLSRHVESGGETGGRGGLMQFGQQPVAERVEGGRRGFGIVDGANVQHDLTVPLTNSFVNDDLSARITNNPRQGRWVERVDRPTGISAWRVLRFDALRDLAAGAGIPPAQPTLAWLLHQGKNIVPLPGTRTPSRIDENAAATVIRLGPDVVWLASDAAPLGSTQDKTPV